MAESNSGCCDYDIDYDKQIHNPDETIETETNVNTGKQADIRKNEEYEAEKSQKSIKRRKAVKDDKKLLQKQFDKLFAANKHHFDMTCDNCSCVFESFDEAQSHYANEHTNLSGYIKCCNTKFRLRNEVEDHIKLRHLEYEQFKYVLNGLPFQCITFISNKMNLTKC